MGAVLSPLPTASHHPAGLCRRLAALGTRAAATPHPEREELELSRVPEVLQDHVGQQAHGG